MWRPWRRPAPTPPGKRHGWVIGWKTANLIVSNSGSEARFMQVVKGIGLIADYGINAEAACTQRPYHNAPSPGCGCGFNAFHEQTAARSYMARPWRGQHNTSNLVLLRVGLAGRIIDGTHKDNSTWGYKAQRQVVTDMFVPANCRVCGASLLDCMPHFQLIRERSLYGYSFALPVCEEHGHGGFTLRALTKLLPGVNIHWDETLPIGQLKPSVVAAPQTQPQSRRPALPTSLDVNIGPHTEAALEWAAAHYQCDIREALRRLVEVGSLVDRAAKVDGAEILLASQPNKWGERKSKRLHLL